MVFISNEVIRAELTRKLGNVPKIVLEDPLNIRDALEWFLKHTKEFPAER